MKKTFLQYILAIILLFPSIASAAVITIHVECQDPTSTCTNYTPASQNLIDFVHQNNLGDSVVKKTFYPNPDTNQSAYEYLASQPDTKGLAKKCQELPITVASKNNKVQIFCSDQNSELLTFINSTTEPTEPIPVITTEPDTSITAEPDHTPPPSGYTPKSVSYDLKDPITGGNLNIPTKDADLLHMVAPILVRVINLFLVLIGIIAITFVIFNGYQMITSGGNQEQIKKGKEGLTYAIIGLTVTLLASLVLQTIQNLLGLV